MKSDRFTRRDHFLDMFRVKQLPYPEMRVHVNQGTVIHENTLVNFEDQDSDYLDAPNVGSWVVVLSVDSLGRLVYTYGVQSVDSPAFPTLPDDCFHLAAVLLSADTEQVTDDLVFDLRQIYGFSSSGAQVCQCKCPVAGLTLSDEDRAQLKAYYDKVAELQQEVEDLKLLLQPRQVYTVLTDSGLKYEVRFRDDGTPYFTRVGGDASNVDYEETQPKTLAYKFSLGQSTLNVVNHDNEDYVPITVRIKSTDSANSATVAALIVSCRDARIYSENFVPQYREDEFRVDDLRLDRLGFVERFSFNFHHAGDHRLSLALYDVETRRLIDSATVEVKVTFVHGRPERPCGCGDPGCADEYPGRLNRNPS